MSSRSAAQIGLWWRRPRALERPLRRLCCFPHAGVGASVFARWADDLAPGVELCALQLPGRETRLREPPWADVQILAEEVADALPLDVPVLFYGHSFGALVAFEVAHVLKRRGGAQPLGLVVSGRRAPPCPDSESPICELSDEEFLEQVSTRYGGVPEALRRNQELLSLVLPALRADMGITESYRYTPRGPLELRILAFGGASDPSVSRGELGRWEEETTRDFELEMVPGGHFFHLAQREYLLRRVEEWLGREPSA